MMVANDDGGIWYQILWNKILCIILLPLGDDIATDSRFSVTLVRDKGGWGV